MAQKDTCFVTRILRRQSDGQIRGAFALRAANDETVFLGHKIVNSMELEEMDEIEVVMKPDDRPETSAEWVAVRAAWPLEEEDEVAHG